jgi:hypothetical protein
MRDSPTFSTKGDDMAAEMPVGQLHAGFSSPEATPTDWAEGRWHIDEAEVFWLSTCVPMIARTSRRCWPYGTTTRCTFARVRKSVRQRTSSRTHSAFSPRARTVSTVLMSWSKDRPSRSAMQRSANRWPTPTSRSTGRALQPPTAHGLVSATRSARVKCSSIGSLPRPFSASPRASSSARRDGAG